MDKTTFTSPVGSAPPDFSLIARQFTQALAQPQPMPQPSQDNVTIPDTADNAYWAYEQLRNAVEYQEQHLLMRSSIGRFLTRWFSLPEKQQIGYELIRELTKARYLTNNTVSETTLAEIERKLQAYLQLFDLAKQHHGKKQEQRLQKWIINIASADMQHTLLPNPVQDAVINFTYHSFQEHLVPPQTLSGDKATILYAAVHKALLKSDEPTIGFYMFYNQFGQWSHDQASLQATATYFKDFIGTIEKNVKSKQAPPINRMVRANIAPYVILYQTLLDSPQPQELVLHPEKLASRATEMCDIQFKKARKRLKTSVLRAIIFLFITKLAAGLAIEVPYEQFVYGSVHAVPLAINLLFPPLYMLLIGLTIKSPNARNTDKIVHDLRAVLYGQGKVAYEVRSVATTKNSTSFNLVYIICTLAVVTGVVALLRLLEFSIVSGIIFFVFLSTVSFFGYRISQSMRELIVVEKRTGLGVLWGVIMTPFIRFGQWLSDRYSKVNIFMLILDFIIEAPFKTLLRLYEQWTAFLREKQDDVLK